MKLYDFGVLEHCNYCTKGPACMDPVRKCIMSLHMKLGCRSPWGSEIYTNGMFVASRNVAILHRLAVILKLDRAVYYSDEDCPKYRLTSDAFDMAVRNGAKQIGDEQFKQLMT